MMAVAGPGENRAPGPQPKSLLLRGKAWACPPCRHTNPAETVLNQYHGPASPHSPQSMAAAWFISAAWYCIAASLYWAASC